MTEVTTNVPIDCVVLRSERIAVLMDWISTLDQTVKSYWSSTGKAYLLSWIPAAMAKAGVELSSVLKGRKLKDAIQEDGRDVLRTIRHPEFPLAWAVVPLEAQVTNLKELFPSTKKEELAVAHESPRFARAVWLAFSKPLKPHQRRFLEIGPPSKMYDISESEPPPPLGLEVDSSLIYNSEPALLPLEERDEHVERAIHKWAAEHDVSIDKLTPKLANRITANREGQDPTGGLIDFSGLSNSEKARILIPLDLIAKLRFLNK